MPKPGDRVPDVGRRERRMTPARVHEQPDHAVVKFLESARIYRMPCTNRDYARALCALRAAAANSSVLRVRLVEPNGEVIESVAADD